MAKEPAAPAADQPVEEIKPARLEAPIPAPPPLAEVSQNELDANYQLLSASDMEEIKAAALAQFTKERRAAARAVAIKGELARLERTHGKRMLGGHLDDLVSIVVDLPENSNEVIIDQERITHGMRITRPRHVINSIMETMWRGQLAEFSLSGKTREDFYRRQRPVEVTRQSFQVLEGVNVLEETVRVA